MAYYDDFPTALKVAVRIKTSGVTYVGAEAFEVFENWEYEVPVGKGALVVVEFEGTRGEVKVEVEYVTKILQETGGVFAPSEDAKGYATGYEMIWCGLRANKDLTGDALCPYVPIEKLEEYYDKVWNEIMPKYGMEHAPLTEKRGLDAGRYEMGYGSFLVPKGPEGFRNYRKAMRELAELTTSLGGSIAACMGVGIKYRDFLGLEYSEEALETMRVIKRALDPDNIMNPGKKIPDAAD